MENNTPYIQKAVLIDDRRIELYWNTQVRRADCEKNFLVKYAGEKRELFHWTSNMEWSYGTLYQKESMRTTLSLSEPVDVSCASKLTVQVSGEVEDLEDHPADYTRVYEVVYEPYYTTQICTNCGIVVKAGKTVQRSSVEKAAVIVDMMPEKLPQVAQELVRRQASVAVYGLKENAFDVPGHRMGYLLATRHIEGFGGEMTNPLSSISEANVIRLRSGRYATSYPHEMILVHEFGHAIHLVGMDGLEDKMAHRAGAHKFGAHVRNLHTVLDTTAGDGRHTVLHLNRRVVKCLSLLFRSVIHSDETQNASPRYRAGRHRLQEHRRRQGERRRALQIRHFPFLPMFV